MIRPLVFTSTMMLVASSALAQEPWVAVWAGPPAQQIAPANGMLKPLEDQTVRQRMTVGMAGGRERVTFTNAYGSKPLAIGAASVGKLVNGKLDPTTIRPLTFGGSPSIIVPIGAPALSDPAEVKISPGDVMAISLYLPKATLPETYHRAIGAVDTAGTTLGADGPEAIVSTRGDFTRAADLPGATSSQRLFISRIDILATRSAGAVVVLGTTRTEGSGRWPDILAQRLAAAGRPLSVVNASMVANPLTRPYPGGGEAALARFDRDVLMVPGVRYVILADAINDIGQAGGVAVGAPIPTVTELAAAYRQLVSRAHARGVRVIASTLMPFAGVPFPNFYKPEKDVIRQDLNQWIRNSGVFDGVIDMDLLVRDQSDPLQYAGGIAAANHFAPSEVGEKRIGQAIDLALFH